MSTVTVDLPESLHAAAGALARESGVTVGQLLASALAEKVAALAGPGWLEARAARGDRARFEEALGKVADVEPDERDRPAPEPR
ncbi:MAG: toxin-antitoxin system HicB family antitoxin [Isosphaera sp.]|nr:toxin-antitoxin system HicB family antitoxin [Isosphaera sp.]